MTDELPLPPRARVTHAAATSSGSGRPIPYFCISTSGDFAELAAPEAAGSRAAAAISRMDTAAREGRVVGWHDDSVTGIFGPVTWSTNDLVIYTARHASALTAAFGEVLAIASGPPRWPQ